MYFTVNISYKIIMKNAKEWIRELNLKPHVEGGYFKEILKSSETINGNSLYTSILFLLEDDNCSNFHQLKSDEVWYFHDGNSLTVHMINPEDGSYKNVKLGKNIADGEVLQLVVPKGMIFGSSVDKGYGLVSCMVAPGFRYEEFKLFSREELMEKFGQHREIIERLSRG